MPLFVYRIDDKGGAFGVKILKPLICRIWGWEEDWWVNFSGNS